MSRLRLSVRTTGKTPLGRHVAHDVAVEEPVPLALRRPRHRHRAARWKQLRDDPPPVRVVLRDVPQSVPEAVHVEVEAVKMHRVGLRTEVDDAPPDPLAEAV